MRKLTYIVLIGSLVVTGLMGTGVAQSVLAKAGLLETKEVRICELENLAYGPGERIVYKLYYNLNFIWLSAGEVEFKVQDLGDRYKLTALGTTYSTYEWFFKVRDYYESYVDKETLLPILTIREIEEGNYTLYERVEYDQETGLGVGYRGKSKEEAMERPGEFAMEHCMHDILSAVYFMRNLNLETASPNSVYPVTVFMDRKKYPLDVRYIGKEQNKKIKGLGRFNVYELAPEVVAGDVFSEDSEMRVWASTANSHVPLQIESPISVGSIKAVLMEHQNLRYSLED
ncbi:MAG: DUF3108 domain-containing protein [Saprospiraceae bacterium]